MQMHQLRDHGDRRGPEDYPLGHAVSEQRRLAAQAQILRPVTERLLRDAGLRPGMRVLDVGCGVGDVTYLAAELVGGRGSVVGVDFGEPVLRAARSRAPSLGIDWVRFVNADAATLTLERLGTEPFDAVIGRLVLMYQADPTAVLRRLAGLVHPGGLVAFLEGVLLPPLARPVRPLYATWIKRLIETFELSGALPDMALRLHQTFIDAGLPTPQTRLEGVMIAGADPGGFRWLAELIRTMSRAIESAGVARMGGVDIDALADGLIAEAAATPGSVCGLALGGAWGSLQPVARRIESGSAQVFKGAQRPAFNYPS